MKILNSGKTIELSFDEIEIERDMNSLITIWFNEGGHRLYFLNAYTDILKGTSLVMGFVGTLQLPLSIPTVFNSVARKNCEE
jgi:hypothetical protein